MITANLIHRTFRIRVGTSVGTGFTIDVGGTEYLVTAKHVARSFSPENPLELFTADNGWQVNDAQLLGHAEGNDDVSVFATSTRLTPLELVATPTSSGMTYGQDAYFLGYPFGVMNRIAFGAEGWPMPLVKKAVVSAFNQNVYLLDGHNNPGFSGGPVVFGDYLKVPDKIGGIVSAYRFEESPVKMGDDNTGLTVQTNTGIMVVFKIEVALELIKQR